MVCMKLASPEQHPTKKFSLPAGRSFQPKKYILRLCESMIEDKAASHYNAFPPHF